MYGRVNRNPLLPISLPALGFSFTISIPILTDLDTVLVDLDSSLFPGVSSDVKVHAGFREAHSLYDSSFGNLGDAFLTYFQRRD
jgi:hypothetical protein